MSSEAVVVRGAGRSQERTSIFHRIRTRRERVPLVRDLMSTDVLVCQRSDSCADVAERMRQSNVGMLPVLDGRDLVGVVTDRDLALRHVPAAEKGTRHSNVGACMTAKVVSVSSDTRLEQAVRTMRDHQVRRLLVVDDGTLQGVLTLDDVFVESGASSEAQHVVQEALVGTRGTARP